MTGHLVLSRKWRPQRFSEVVGQDHVVSTLQNALAAGRIAHAYLFSGPRGTGKTTVARILAKAVNCLNLQNPETKPEPCNECPNCKSIASGRTFDVIEMDAASSRGIDQIRELRENVKLAPTTCRYKVYIIDEVHMLTPEAFNALLKTLEEPPPHVIFILATTEKHKVLDTILSRCLQFNFRRLSVEEISKRLKFLAEAEGFDVEEEAISIIARNSDGCLRDAENILEQMVASSGGKVTAEHVSKMLGLGSARLMDELFKSVIKRDAARAVEAVEKLVESGADLTQCLKNLTSAFHDLMLLKVSPDLRKLIDAPSSKISELLSLAPQISLERVRRILKVLMRAEAEMKGLGYERFVLEAALIEACQLGEGRPLEEVLERLEDMEAKIEAAISLEPAPQAVQPPPPPKPEPKAEERPPIEEAAKPVEEAPQRAEGIDVDLQEVWGKLVEGVRDISIALHNFMKDGRPVKLEGDKLVIAVPTQMTKEFLEEIESKQQVDELLQKIVGRPVRLEVIVEERRREVEERNMGDPTYALWQKAMSDEGVRMVMNAFSGEIVDITEGKTWRGD